MPERSEPSLTEYAISLSGDIFDGARSGASQPDATSIINNPHVTVDRARHQSSRQNGALLGAGAVLVASVAGAVGLSVFEGGNASQPADAATQKSTELADNDKEKNLDWSLHYYQFDHGVPQSYFGPNCAPQAFNPEVCLDEMETRTRRDPMLLSVALGEFGLIPGQTADMSVEQKEAIRLSFAEQLKDEDLRKEYHEQLEEKLEDLEDLKIEYLSGVMFSKYVTPEGNVVQIQKEMNPAINYAIVGTDKAGNKYMFKMDCGFQPVSEVPFEDVPEFVLPKKDPNLSYQYREGGHYQGRTPSGGNSHKLPDPFTKPEDVPADGYVPGTVDKPKPQPVEAPAPEVEQPQPGDESGKDHKQPTTQPGW